MTNNPFGEQPAQDGDGDPGSKGWPSSRVVAVIALVVLVVGGIGLGMFIVADDASGGGSDASSASRGGSDTAIDAESTTTTTTTTTTATTSVSPTTSTFSITPASDPDDSPQVLEVTTDTARIEVAPGADFTVGVQVINNTGHPLELDGCPYASATWTLDDGSGEPQRSSGSVTACLDETTTWATGDVESKTFDFTAPSDPAQATFTVIIEFPNPGVTVTIPGVVTE